MERLNNRLNYSGQTYETSKDLRISNRPPTLNSNAFGNFPSTLGPSKKKGETGVGKGVQSSQTRPKFKPAITEQRSSTRPPAKTHPGGSKSKPLSSDESSEDEMNLLSDASQHGHDEDPSSSLKLVSSSRKTTTQKSTNATSSMSGQEHGKQSEDFYVDNNGVSHPYHPNFKPVPNKYAGMSFKTKTKGSETTTREEKQSDSSSSSKKFGPVSNENAHMSNNGPSSWSPVINRHVPSYIAETGKDDIMDLASSPLKNCGDNDVTRTSPLSGKSANSNRAHTPTPSIPRHSRDVGSSVTSESLGKTTKERPKPVPIRRGPQTKDGETRSIVDVLGLPSRQPPKSSSPEPPVPRNKKPHASKRSSKRSDSDPKPAPFPMDSTDLLTQPEAAASSEKKQSIGYPLSGKPFPMMDGSRSTRHGSQAIAPARSSKEKAQARGKSRGRKSDDEDEEENEGEKQPHQPPKPQAFPMSSTDWNPGSPSPRRSKRNSDHGSEDERTVKKSRKGKDHFLGPSSDVPFFDEGDSMSLAPQADPKTLCPFCDTSLPRYPSPLLLKLLEETKKRATKDPRPTNPLGFRAPLTTYIVVCRRHLFESKILPEAERKGWPKAIKWKKVGGRVLKMKDFLQALIEDAGDTREETALPGVSEWEIAYGGGPKTSKGKGKAKGPKASSIFWTETMQEIEKKGLRAVLGVRGQYASFEKAQPGYYGEMGSVIIYQTLYNMFPPTEIDPNLISPLTPTEFIQRILVPEAALHLIMEDQDLDGEDGMKKALEILRDSSSYGVAMFPEDGGEWGDNKRPGREKMGEADLIVMERARKRRKELKEEEEREEEEQRLQYEKERKLKEAQEGVEAEKAKKIKRGRIERVPSVVREPIAERPRPRPVPIKKLKAATSSSIPASEDEKLESNRRWTGSRGSSTVSDESDMENDNARRPSSEERRRSPSASESWLQENTRRAILSRAPSHDMARLSIGRDSPVSDSSTRALVNGEGRASSRNMKVDTSDSEVEFVGDMKTPIPNRERHPSTVDDDDTPKPSHSRKPDSSKPLAPLLLARQRNGVKSGKSNLPGPSRNSQGYRSSPPSEKSFGWLFDSSSPHKD